MLNLLHRQNFKLVATVVEEKYIPKTAQFNMYLPAPPYVIRKQFWRSQMKSTQDRSDKDRS